MSLCTVHTNVPTNVDGAVIYVLEAGKGERQGDQSIGSAPGSFRA